jgi:antitoxin component YwqK of YwqJK toxin-antitoxin module
MDRFLILSYVASQDGNIKGTILRDNKFIMKGNETGSLIEKLQDGSINYIEMNLITGVGFTKNYYKDGTLHYCYEQTKGVRNGDYVQYYPDGTLHVKAYFRENKLDGEELRYTESGKLLHRINHINGFMEGVALTYNTSGKIQHERRYKKNKLESIRCHDLKIDSEYSHIDCFYKNNNEEETKEYYKNGICSLECYYVNGKLNGKYIRYDMKGRIHTEGNYKDDKKIGEFKYYDTRGKITHTDFFV